MYNNNMTYYGIYKITNLLNGKMYIGQHTTSNIDDGYMGSGKIILRALKKYGVENFRKEWLMFCEDEEELNYMERVYVDQTWVDRSDTYNLNLGGDCQHLSEQTRKKISNALKDKLKSLDHCLKLSIKKKNNPVKYWKGKKFSDEYRRKLSEAHKGISKGKKLSTETRKKISEKRKLYWSKKKESKKYDEMVS